MRARRGIAEQIGLLPFRLHCRHWLASHLRMTSRSTTQTASLTPTTQSRLGGLDGLRAIAVGLVVIYHLFPAALPGGFLGVDVFFVISGFLIATLLISEHGLSGRIALASFWRRRARRLLPALGVVLLVCTSAAYFVDRDLLVDIGAQILGASLFASNWVFIALGSDYFAQGHPELFRNTWSLAIEEQFYVVLPLVLLFALRMRSRTTRALFFALFGIASAVWMGVLFAQGTSSTRVYFGTDTHVFGLLLGVALACLTGAPSALRAASEYRSVARFSRAGKPLARWQQFALLAVGTVGLAVLIWLALNLREGSPESFMGGFQLATVAVLAVVWAATRPGAWLGVALDVQPLRWIGERSYGIYLWHWPVLLIVGALAAEAGASSWSAPVLTLIITLALAALSYRFIEQPVRRIGLRRSLARVARIGRLRGRSLVVGVATVCVAAVTVSVSGLAIATAPAPNNASEVVARGQAALDARGDDFVPVPTRDQVASADGDERIEQLSSGADVGAGAGAEAAEGLGPKGLGTAWASQPQFVAPKPAPIEGWEIFAVGDSVMLASAPELAEAFPDIWIDAAVSRGMSVGVDLVKELNARGELRAVLVVGLGTNGPIDDSDLEDLLRVADGRRIVLVNAYADRWWIPEVNQQLRTFADKHRGVTLADWAGTIPGVPGGLAGDDIHPNPSGGIAYASTVQAALDALREKNEQPKAKPSQKAPKR